MIPIYYPLLYIVIIKYVPIYFFFLKYFSVHSLLAHACTSITLLNLSLTSFDLLPERGHWTLSSRQQLPKKKKKYKRTIITSTHISLSICHLAVPCPPSVCKWEAEFPWLLSLVIMRAFPESVDVFLDVSLKKKEGKKITGLMYSALSFALSCLRLWIF